MSEKCALYAAEYGSQGFIDYGEVGAENTAEGFPGGEDAQGDAGPCVEVSGLVGVDAEGRAIELTGVVG